MLRFLSLVGGALAAWRMLAGRYNRPVLAHPHDLVQTVDTHTRNIAIASVPNLRDIGGYLTQDGLQVRWGRIYRSGSIATLSDADFEVFAGLNIRMICDLRTEDEATEAPDRVPDSATYQHIRTRDVDNQLRHLGSMLFKPHYLHHMLKHIYTEVILEQNAPMFKAIFERVAQAENLPLLIHCTAGKDRTGLAVALLLLVLGVDEQAVLADYSQSNLAFGQIKHASERLLMRLYRLGLSEKDTDALLLADPQTLAYALAHLREHYSSIEGYLTSKAGVSHEVLQAIRNNLLERPA